MGLTPHEVGDLSIWELRAMAGGFAKANGSDQEETLTAEDQEELGDVLRAMRS